MYIFARMRSKCHSFPLKAIFWRGRFICSSAANKPNLLTQGHLSFLLVTNSLSQFFARFLTLTKIFLYQCDVECFHCKEARLHYFEKLPDDLSQPWSLSLSAKGMKRTGKSSLVCTKRAFHFRKLRNHEQKPSKKGNPIN